jgi:nucleotide-binding universal stress UspA family protein
MAAMHGEPTDRRPPAQAPLRDTRTLLLATDLADASASATDEAFDLAGRLGARLLIVSVIDPGSLKLPGGRYRARIDQVRERREELAQALVAPGRELGLDVSFLVWTGDPGDVILEAAEAERTSSSSAATAADLSDASSGACPSSSCATPHARSSSCGRARERR